MLKIKWTGHLTNEKKYFQELKRKKILKALRLRKEEILMGQILAHDERIFSN